MVNLIDNVLNVPPVLVILVVVYVVLFNVNDAVVLPLTCIFKNHCLLSYE